MKSCTPIFTKLCYRYLALAFLTVGAQAAFLDDNGNGLSDVWEAAHGPALVPTVDLDGDSQTNLQESIAGTNPRDSASFFKLGSLQILAPALTRLRWDSVIGKSYQVGASFNLQQWPDVGVPLAGTGGVLQVDLPMGTTFLTGKATLSRWTNQVPSAGMDTVRTNITNNVVPSETGFVTSLEVPAFVPNQDNYGQYIRGWIVPQTTGTYTFYLASDDTSEFWLGTSRDPLSKQRLLALTAWTGFREWAKYPSQQSVPVALIAGQSYFFEVLQKEWTGGDHVSVAWMGPGFPTPTVIGGAYLATAGGSLADQSAGSVFFRVKASDTDSDRDGLSDADEAMVGTNPLTATTVPRVSDLASIRAALAAPNVVTAGSPQARAYEDGLQGARLTFFRSGNVNPIDIFYSTGGTATSGSDYVPLSGVARLKLGENSVSVDVTPIADVLVEGAETVSVSVNPSTAYQGGNPSQTTVTIDDAPDILYVANLRPQPGTRSGGYGTLALNVAGNGVFGTVNVSFANLLSSQIATQLYISSTGTSGTSVLALPLGQVTGTRWDFTPAGGSTSNDLRQALNQGRLYARVMSSGLPSGEIFGQLVSQQAWQNMPVPPSPPPLPTGAPTAAEAARFLVQATYGPTPASIARVQQLGYSAWLDEQFAMPSTLHLPYVQTRRAEFLAASNNVRDGWQTPRQEAWWQVSLAAPDQLRQRMAFALSEIFVVSDNGVLDGEHEGITNYYDLLVKSAFGSYRTLLEDATLSPMMGQYLSMIQNQKPNPTTGAEPDENYAREIMQLFSIGLNQLNLDGSLKIGSTGFPIPTYSQADIVGLAHVFTGWSYSPANGEAPNFHWGARDQFSPMREFPAYHDTAQKIILNNTIIPANLTMSQDLALALSAISNHANVGPFIARQLIQRFVTSNPSPGYIYRVASVFNNNGTGVRGDFRAVLKAILLDYEARSADLLTDQAHGKQKEPLLRISHLLRAMNVTAPKPGDDRFYLNLSYVLTSQAALKSPSVFNFFQPGYIPPGILAANGLYAPEFQITSETTVIKQSNAQHELIFWGFHIGQSDPSGNAYRTRLNPSDQVALLNRVGFTALQNQAALLDNLNLLLLNGRMSPGLRQNITTTFAALPSWFNSAQNQRDRVNVALWLIMASPEFAIQK